MNSEIISIISDYGEVTLDSFLKEGVLKNLPVVGPAFSCVKISKEIQDRIFVEKMKTFIENIEKNKNWKSKFENEDECMKISKKLIYIINSSDDDEKIKLIAHVFNSFVIGDIDKDMFFYLSSIISKSYYSYIKLLPMINENRFLNDGEKYDMIAIYHLYSIGLFNFGGNTIMLFSENKGVKPAATIVEINIYGKILKKILEELN